MFVYKDFQHGFWLAGYYAASQAAARFEDPRKIAWKPRP